MSGYIVFGFQTQEMGKRKIRGKQETNKRKQEENNTIMVSGIPKQIRVFLFVLIHLLFGRGFSMCLEMYCFVGRFTKWQEIFFFVLWLNRYVIFW